MSVKIARFSFLLLLMSLSSNLIGMRQSGGLSTIPYALPTPISEQKWDWVEVPSPAGDESVASCDFISANDGWAVTGRGTMLHWYGSQWLAFRLPDRDYELTDVDMVSSNDVWAVGLLDMIIHWDGSKWTQFPSPMGPSYDLWSVSFSEKDTVGFIAGAGSPPHSTDFQRIVLRWDGTSWYEVPFPEEPRDPMMFTFMRMIAWNDGWATSDAYLYQWNGTTWKPWNSYVPGKTPLLFSGLYDFSVLASNDVWAVGRNANASSETEGSGVILHWDGKDWIKVATARDELYSIRMLSTQEGWATGVQKDATGTKVVDQVLLHWNGERWAEYPVPVSNDFSLSTICGPDIQHLWIFSGRGSNQALRLMEKSASPPAATATFTPALTLTGMPTATFTAIPMETLTIQPPAHLAPEAVLPQTGGNPWLPVAFIGGILVIGLVFLLGVTRSRK